MHIAGDWGSTHLRLWLCEGSNVLASAQGPGVSVLAGQPEGPAFGAVLSRCTKQWDERYGSLPVILCGMIGSRNGWREAPYLPCPADTRTLGRSLVSMTESDRRIAIVPGVRCARSNAGVDVMRGEETQIHGALNLLAHGTGSSVFCLPGTHTKWACVEDGRIVTFWTGLSGEAFALLAGHSMLLRVHPPGAEDEVSPSAFSEALDHLPGKKDGGLLQQLFQVRSRQLLLGLAPDRARALLSAMLIDHDVSGALAALAESSIQFPRMVIIGADRIAQLFALSLQRHGVACDLLDAESATRQGLLSILGEAPCP